MPVKLGPWGVIIGGIALVVIVLSLLFFTRQVQDAPVPTPTGPVPAVTAEITPETDLSTREADETSAEETETPLLEATTES